ncbi:class I SAM-dependent methyltransferase [Streptomyces caniscabiei]|uniref:class I SAM-dependent methyltransferase n=1 Tax=Streptomyces caniscabiei TaxID=2746961 RepID=UPI0029B6DA22|nr:class I SAM-dependent methyltransferase [Streptomyces caniscabiei]MDX2603068.1 class I SAM-dependent methyltransferase [Streptomyces caniscabiei]MDX2737645.1 class I SAM-dependent methyltransferase [Streptomyces caniscabiei]
MARPVGTVTRGTTNPNRLRRMDRWIAATHGAALRRAATPLAVDLGYGAAPWTAVELLRRLRTAAPRTQVVGVEIDPARVTAAEPYACEGLTFRHGGFEVPVPGRPTLIRAANVLRQYDEDEVAAVWARLCARLEPAARLDPAAPSPPGRAHSTTGPHPAPGPRHTPGPHSPTAPYPSGGLLVEGTCDEIGRRHVWVALGPEGPRTVTFATRLGSLDRPSDLAERLPKALIHRNVPGEPVHAFLRDFDRAWAAAAPYASYGARQRWIRTIRALSADWPVRDGVSRWRQGEVTVAWEALAPRFGG